MRIIGELPEGLIGMADSAIAIVSIVSGATVAIVVPVVSARLERNRLRWQARSARIDELRDVLDAGLQAMSLVRGGLEAALTGMEGLDGVRETEVREREMWFAQERREEGGAALPPMRKECNRLAVRLGLRHEVVRAYVSGLNALANAYESLKSNDPELILASGNVHGLLDRVRDALNKAEEAEFRFVDAAKTLVGAEPL